MGLLQNCYYQRISASWVRGGWAHLPRINGWALVVITYKIAIAPASSLCQKNLSSKYCLWCLWQNFRTSWSWTKISSNLTSSRKSVRAERQPYAQDAVKPIPGTKPRPSGLRDIREKVTSQLLWSCQPSRLLNIRIGCQVYPPKS